MEELYGVSQNTGRHTMLHVGELMFPKSAQMRQNRTVRCTASAHGYNSAVKAACWYVSFIDAPYEKFKITGDTITGIIFTEAFVHFPPAIK